MVKFNDNVLHTMTEYNIVITLWQCHMYNITTTTSSQLCRNVTTCIHIGLYIVMQRYHNIVTMLYICNVTIRWSCNQQAYSVYIEATSGYELNNEVLTCSQHCDNVILFAGIRYNRLLQPLRVCGCRQNLILQRAPVSSKNRYCLGNTYNECPLQFMFCWQSQIINLLLIF